MTLHHFIGSAIVVLAISYLAVGFSRRLGFGSILGASVAQNESALSECHRVRGGDLLAVLVAAWLAQGVGLSMALGAVVVELLLSGSPFQLQVESFAEPWKELLLSLFFIAVGMNSPGVALWFSFQQNGLTADAKRRSLAPSFCRGCISGAGRYC